MKQIFKLSLLAAALFSVIGCSTNERAELNFNVKGAENKEIILSKLSVNKIDILDTLQTDAAGSVKYRVDVAKDAPEFYYLSYNRKRLVSLIAKGGDKIDVTVDTLGSAPTITGSEESVLLTEIEKEIYNSTVRFDSIAVAMTAAAEANDQKLSQELSLKAGALFVAEKRAAIKRVMTNPKSFTNVILLYRRFNDNIALFSDNLDFIYYKTVYDSLSPLYPNSVYVKAIKNDADNLQRMAELSNKIAEAAEIPFPELELPDIQSQKHKLSELQGKPFILFFWTVADDEHKMYNLELKKVYDRYAERGFNIYQVCVDADKAAWASVMKEQALPWINVCDGLGASSPAVSTYALQGVPALFLFNSDGEIVARDLFNIEELTKAVGRLF